MAKTVSTLYPGMVAKTAADKPAGVGKGILYLTEELTSFKISLRLEV